MYPKVLIINSVPFNNESISSNYFLNNLFKEWPINDLAQIYVSNKPPNMLLCDSYWRSKILGLSKYSEKRHICDASNNKINISHIYSIKKRIYSLVRSDIKHDVASLIDFIMPRTTSEFLNWLKEFDPSVVYSWLGSNRVMSLVRIICAAHKIRFVPHFMDDWMKVYSRRPVINKILLKRLNNNYDGIKNYIKEGIAISEDMAEEYSFRYGIPMNVIANGVEDNILCELKKGLYDHNTVNNKHRISLLGRLEYSRIKILNTFMKAVQENERYNKEIVLSLYTSSEIPRELLGRQGKVIVLKKNPPVDGELKILQRETDCLLYLDDFEEYARQYFRLSMSSKIPLYLALGRPIFTIGPSDVNSVKYLEKCDLGPVVTENNIRAISLAINRTINIDIKERIKIGERAWRIAEKVHRNKNARDKLYEIMDRNSREILDKDSHKKG